VLATRGLRTESGDATLNAPEHATASTLIEVHWTGPGNSYDVIGVHERRAPDDSKPLSHASILGRRNPVDLKLPDTQGDFELRYRTAQSGQVLARRAIRIAPSGRLAVGFERDGEVGTASTEGVGAVELILDASGSMLQKVGDARRIEIARRVLDDLVRNQLADNTPFALRVFGHQQADGCRTDLEIPLAALDRAGAAAKIASIDAMNLAKTPIADSLARIPADLATARGSKTVVLITDGEETCDGDPAAVIKQLRASGVDLQVSIVGFAIDDQALRSTFKDWAELGGGSYFDAHSADELRRSLRTVISGPFRVFDSKGDVVGHGVIGGAPIVLPAGSYRVETVGSDPRVIESVEVKPGELSKATF
jgi:hypothetical protein